MNTLSTSFNDDRNNDSQTQIKLQLEGQCGYQLDEGTCRALINIEKISNHRDLGNLSGTLAIQLRAYRANQPKDDQSYLLASTTVGQINGQYYLENCLYDLIYTAPAPGTWRICLELREWSEQDYSLCDQITFPVPMQIDFQPTLVEKGVERPVVKTTDKIAAEKTTSKLNTTEKHTTDFATPQTLGEIDESTEKTPTKSRKSSKSKTKRVDQSGLTFVNQCSMEDILDTKGISKKIAKEIVQHRPYNKWKELLDIKGVGPKLLERIKKALKEKAL
ncbi:ComEA family DNA-binding protein [Marinomonas balearica]|uniref:Helix-hairpin-helix protein n=1 Tax=Marinomonas balearica TaxID=491947 RepID=A0A4R6M8K5_9GAMM|nr:helix-hairpin-helix domain-containing protein [Marinomonas balearica]TDO97516.1 helix-hairpin-helix protein [Marinomonas balearica]